MEVVPARENIERRNKNIERRFQKSQTLFYQLLGIFDKRNNEVSFGGKIRS